MKYLKITIFIIILFSFSCSQYRKIRLTYGTFVSLPINTKENSIKILQSSEFSPGIPSVYQIGNNGFYIIDEFNSRILKYNKKNEIILKITNIKKNNINLVYEGSNRTLQPLNISKNLFDFNKLGNLLVSKNDIYIESILEENDDSLGINSYSLILKYNKDGIPVNVIGNRLKKSNKILPFQNLEKFSIDRNDNIFIYLKNDENREVLKLNKDNNIIYCFSSFDFLRTNNIITDIKKNERIIIENIDNSADGDFLIIALAYFKNEIKFQKVVYYKIDLKTNRMVKLFTMDDENYHFILIDDSNKLYIWETEENQKDIEHITIRIYNTKGKVINNYTITLDRNDAQWFDIKLQKDGKITGINIKNNKFYAVVWK